MNLSDILSEQRTEELFEESGFPGLRDEKNGVEVLAPAGVGGVVDGVVDVVDGAVGIDEPKNGLYYLPTRLSKIQRDLCEIVLQIFSGYLVDEVRLKRHKTSISSLLDSEKKPEPVDNGSLGREEKAELVFDQLRLITKHPSLLVDHFMPKKLLLLELNERLVSASGKFELFNRLVDSLIDGCDERNCGLGMLVVAHSVKEVELVEGLIIGKRLRYYNLCTEKLYDDGERDEVFRELSTSSKATSRTKKRKLGSFKGSDTVPRSEVKIYLTTALQLYNNYTTAITSPLALIFSFDPEIDVTNPSIELLRSCDSRGRAAGSLLSSSDNSHKTPIFVPVPVFSVEHLCLQYPKTGDEKEFDLDDKAKKDSGFQRRLKILNALAVQRHQLYEEEEPEFYLNKYGKSVVSLKDWIFDWDKKPFPATKDNTLAFFDEQLKLHFNDDKLVREIQTNYLRDFGSTLEGIRNEQRKKDQTLFEISRELNDLEVFNYKTYRSKLTEFIHQRILQVERTANDVAKQAIPVKRSKDSLVHISIDTNEDKIRANYQILKVLNDEANATERKIARVETDTSKYREQEESLVLNLQHLKLMLVQPDEKPNVESKISEQKTTLSSLRDELDTMKTEYDKLCHESESLRAKYQSSSSEAAQISSTVKTSHATNASLLDKLNGVGMKSLPSLMRQDELISYKITLEKLEKENHFMAQFYDEKLDKLVKERSIIMENTSTGSLSRPSNRISRAATPL